MEENPDSEDEDDATMSLNGRPIRRLRARRKNGQGGQNGSPMTVEPNGVESEL